MTTDIGIEDRQHRADALRERIYITFAALAVVLALGNHHAEAPKALLTLVVTVVGAVLALFVADFISHIVVHERMMSPAELRHAASVTFGALSAIGVPVVLLLISIIWGWNPEVALTASAFALIVALIVIGYAATRRIPMTWWQRLVALGAEAALGLAVIGLQVLAKS